MEQYKIRVVDPTFDLLRIFRGRFRWMDDEECMASNGHSAYEAARIGLEISLKSWLAFYDGRPLCAFGVVPLTNNEGSPWFLGTTAMGIPGAKIGVGRLSKVYLKEMAEGFTLLHNHVDDRYELAKKWLKWCGFNLGDPHPYGVARLPFRRFWIDTEGL